MADNTCDLQTLAKLLELTPRRIQQLTTEGVFHKAKRGQYLLIPCIQGYARYQAELLKQSDAPESQEAVNRLKCELMSLQIEEKKMELAKKSKGWVESKPYQRLWRDSMILTRVEFLQVADHLANHLQHLTDPRKVYDIANEKLRAIWNKLADSLEAAFQTQLGEDDDANEDADDDTEDEREITPSDEEENNDVQNESKPFTQNAIKQTAPWGREYQGKQDVASQQTQEANA